METFYAVQPIVMDNRNKHSLRQAAKLKLQHLPQSRRKEAALQANFYLSHLIPLKKPILSFFPMNDEIDITLFNEKLAASGNLLLPRCVNNTITAHRVVSFTKDLEKGPFSFLQPKEVCPVVEDMGTILVPGLAFDLECHRLGRGRGHYDRFLSHNIPFYGVGFREQLQSLPLPIEPHDVQLTGVFLF